MQHTMLLLSLLALIAGPLFYQYFTSRPYWYRVLDGFVVIMISGIVIIDVLPQIITHNLVGGLVLVGIGLMGPTILEHQFHRIAKQIHWVALIIGILGLMIHAFIDGVVISDMTLSISGASLLGFGVILHRIPVGLTIWMLLMPRLGKVRTIATLMLLGLGTVVGFTFEVTHGVWAEGHAFVLFQALAAGSILHVVLHRPHESHHEKMQQAPSRLMRYGEGIGNLIGIVCLAITVALHIEPEGHGHAEHHHEGGLHFYEGTIEIFMGLLYESAIPLLLAYLAGGMMISMLPAASIHWMRKGPPFVRSVKGVTIGLPLPICTCGVLPLYRSLIQRGAPPTAAMAFLIATPELGLDALLISIPLLGGDMTIIRLAAAAFIALFVGWTIGLLAERTQKPPSTLQSDSKKGQAEALPIRIRKGLKEGFGPLVDDTAPWILIGLLIAAIADPVLQSEWIQGLHNSVEVVLFALLGLPIYVCASGATPIVAILLINSVSPGAALAFLLTGPATNVSTYGILTKVHNKRIAIVFGALTTLVAILIGYLVNLAIPYIDVRTALDLHAEQASVIQRVATIVLCCIFVLSMMRRGARAFVGEIAASFRASGHRHGHENSAACTHDECTHCAT